MKFPCRCCGYQVPGERPPGTLQKRLQAPQVCETCCWQDVQSACAFAGLSRGPLMTIYDARLADGYGCESKRPAGIKDIEYQQ